MTRYVGKCSPDSEPKWLLGPKAATWMLFRGIAISVILILMILTSTVILTPVTANCQPAQTSTSQAHVVDGVMEIKIPEGFKSEGVDEPHIFKWTKDSAEIYIVVGDRLIGSRSAMINAFKKTANADTRLDKVKTIKISNAKAILTKEKPPSDAKRLMSWGLKIFTDKNEINVEFSAPAKDFKTYSTTFEEFVKSIKIKSS